MNMSVLLSAEIVIYEEDAALAGRARYLLLAAPGGCQQNPLSQNEQIH